MKKSRLNRFHLRSVFLLVICMCSNVSHSFADGKLPEWFVVSGSHRTRYEYLNNRFVRGDIGSDDQLALRTQVLVVVQPKNQVLGAGLELEDARIFLEDADSRITTSHVNEHEVLQAYVKVALKTSDSGLNGQLLAGRFTLDIGSRRLMARNSYRNTTNALEGVYGTLTRSGKWEGFFARPVTRKMTDWDTGDSHALFWGVVWMPTSFRGLTGEVIYLGLREDANSTQKRKFATLSGRLLRKPVMGKWDGEVESVWQFGTRAGVDHFAHFQHAAAGYSFLGKWKPRLRFEYDYASGDVDLADKKSGGFDTLFGARRFDFGPTGIYGPFSRSNLHTPGMRFFMGSKSVQVMAALRKFWLAQAKDQWVGSRLQDPDGTSGTSLGEQFEVQVRWKPVVYFQVESGWAFFRHGDFVKRLAEGSVSGSSNLIYLAGSVDWKL
jgi:hypothetical protein